MQAVRLQHRERVLVLVEVAVVEAERDHHRRRRRVGRRGRRRPIRPQPAATATATASRARRRISSAPPPGARTPAGWLRTGRLPAHGRPRLHVVREGARSTVERREHVDAVGRAAAHAPTAAPSRRPCWAPPPPPRPGSAACRPASRPGWRPGAACSAGTWCRRRRPATTPQAFAPRMLASQRLLCVGVGAGRRSAGRTRWPSPTGPSRARWCPRPPTGSRTRTGRSLAWATAPSSCFLHVGHQRAPGRLQPGRVAGLADRVGELVVGDAADVVEVERVGGVAGAGDVGVRPVGGLCR